MNLFDQLVNEALKNKSELSSLRNVVEKELLHHDILRTLSQNKLLTNLTFIGGTCLRTCYGSVRLSEDLDFTGGSDFSRTNLTNMGRTLVESLQEKYGLKVSVTEPIHDKKNVDTWKIKVETSPGQKHLPSQRINIDICAIPSYEKQPMLLINPYGIDMGTNGLIIQAQTREEIFIDKLLAFALRPNRLKYRDLWDIIWLHQHGLKLKLELLPHKLQDRSLTEQFFLHEFQQRKSQLTEDKKLANEFVKEMQRFLPTEQMDKIIEQENFWGFVVFLMNDFFDQLQEQLS